MLRLMLLIYAFIFISHPIYGNESNGVNVSEPIKEVGDIQIIEWRHSKWGVFSNLMQVVEWMYCVKQHSNFGLYVNMNGAYGFKGNLFTALFKLVEDSQIYTNPNGRIISHRVEDFPKTFPDFKVHPTNGMKNFNNSKYIYMNAALYKDPDFSLFRERIHPIIMQYLQPVDQIQKKIDTISHKMSSPTGSGVANGSISTKRNLKIGIHVRYIEHYLGCNKSPTQFLDDVEKDIDLIMKSKDPHTTKIFLATLLQPLVERLSSKYNIVVCEIPRTTDLLEDWGTMPNKDPLEMASDVIVDTWSLANCDEVWGSSSNMIVFAGCLNPNLKIHMLPSLAQYNGS